MTTNLYLDDLRSRIFGLVEDDAWLDAAVGFRLERSAEIVKAHALDPMRMGNRLTSLAEALLEVVAQRATQKVQNRYGVPSYRDNTGQFATSEPVILAMGKFGARELLPEGDLDVIFLYSHWGETRGRNVLTNQEYFARLAQAIIHLLTVRTRSGFLYRMDTGLRPSGNAGVLVTSFDAFTHYHQNEAEGWERLSLLRARPVFGTDRLNRQIEILLGSLLYDPPFPSTLAADLVHLKERMEKELSKETAERMDIKFGPGGILDLELSLQFLQLKLGKMYSDLRSTSTFQMIDALGKRGVLDPARAATLKEAYSLYLKVEAMIRGIELASTNLLARHSMIALETARALGYESAYLLTSRVDELRREVRRFFGETLQTSGS